MSTTTPRTTITRLPEHGVHQLARLHSLLDEATIGHVGLVADGHPVVIPTAVARLGDTLLAHGSTGSRWMRALAAGADASVAVTITDGIVVARSAFESSLHYRSAVLFGRFRALDGEDKARGLDALVDALIPGRRPEVRPSTTRELAATMVLSMPISEWSLKVSDGWPDDAEEDRAGDAWAGVVPITVGYGEPVAAPDARPGLPVPPSVLGLRTSPV